MATSTWNFTNATVNLSGAVRAAMALTDAKARTAAIAAIPAEDNALTVKADTILKNGKPLDGTTVNLTVAHMRDDETFVLAFDPETRIASITRTEGAKGRKAGSGDDVATVTSFVSLLRG